MLSLVPDGQRDTPRGAWPRGAQRGGQQGWGSTAAPQAGSQTAPVPSCTLHRRKEALQLQENAKL